VTQPFDAVLVIAFGGPQAPADVRPFLQNVLHGRRVAPGRVEEVAHHYEAVGGRSPITELTRLQAAGLQRWLADAGTPLPVFVGMRNWHPYLADTLAEMSRAGIRRAVGFIAAAHRSYSSCTQYRENVADARASLAQRGLADVEVTYVEDWYNHPLFVAANADRIRAAIDRLDAPLRDRARLVFTAHSIPESMAAQYPYREQFQESARLAAAAVDGARSWRRDADSSRDANSSWDADLADSSRSRDVDLTDPSWPRDADLTDSSRARSAQEERSDPRPVIPKGNPSDPRPVEKDPSNPRPVERDPRPVERNPPDPRLATVYQSRSGRPEDPWLGPDICDYLRDERSRGLEAVVICPIGFVCDHVEVLYDLDVEAAQVCRAIDLPMVRAQSVNDHPAFLDMMADVVLRTYRRYQHARPLELVAAR
jgi:protoheme ferro-lyase